LNLSGNEKRYATPQRFRVQPGVALTGKVDPEARVAAVHPSITTKGMYLADLMGRLEARVVDDVWPTLQAAPRHGKYQASRAQPRRRARDRQLECTSTRSPISLGMDHLFLTTVRRLASPRLAWPKTHCVPKNSVATATVF
jgi:hypothetical protein